MVDVLVLGLFRAQSVGESGFELFRAELRPGSEQSASCHGGHAAQTAQKVTQTADDSLQRRVSRAGAVDITVAAMSRCDRQCCDGRSRLYRGRLQHSEAMQTLPWHMIHCRMAPLLDQVTRPDHTIDELVKSESSCAQNGL